MHASLSTVLAPLDREAVLRERDELREQLEDCEALLRLINRHQHNETVAEPQEASDFIKRVVAAEAASGNGNGNEHVPVTRKRDTVLAILRQRPGRWSNADMRSELAARGIDPQAGTPVKNIMWKLAKDGIVHASGNGVYEFPALNVSANGDEQEAVGL